MKKQNIVCFGPGPLFKGGIANYNTSLVRTFAKRNDVNVKLVSWTQQYPAIVPREFIDKVSRKKLLDEKIPVEYVTNYNNPLTWKKTVKAILKHNPDKIIFQWYNAQQGLPLSFIVKQLRKKSKAEIIFDLHFVVPKENSSIDTFFTKLGLKPVETYITHAYKTFKELQNLFPDTKFHSTKTGNREKNKKNVLLLYHPVYDLFSPDPNLNINALKQEMGLNKYVFLFFGFIRKYKGLHNCIEAFKILSEKRNDVSLLVCGESFWNTLDESKLSAKIKKFLFGIVKALFLKQEHNEKNYRPLELIEKYGLQDKTVVVNEFIPNEDVPKYFQVSDAVLLFYERATPSGVESLSYNFSLPILATNVGHFPETIENGVNGYLAKAGDFQSMAQAMENIITKPIPKENIREHAKKISWENYVEVILNA